MIGEAVERVGGMCAVNGWHQTVQGRAGAIGRAGARGHPVKALLRGGVMRVGLFIREVAIGSHETVGAVVEHGIRLGDAAAPNECIRKLTCRQAEHVRTPGAKGTCHRTGHETDLYG